MFMVTMQAQHGSYVTKTKRIESADAVGTFVGKAVAAASKVKYDDAFDGMDHGLTRALRLVAASGNEYVLTVHKI